jgi:hypothetical protein
MAKGFKVPANNAAARRAAMFAKGGAGGSPRGAKGAPKSLGLLSKVGTPLQGAPLPSVPMMPKSMTPKMPGFPRKRGF